MSMYLYDDMKEMQDFQNYQDEVRRLEGEYLEIRVLLRDAEEQLRANPESEYLQAKVKYLTKRLKGLESLRHFSLFCHFDRREKSRDPSHSLGMTQLRSRSCVLGRIGAVLFGTDRASRGAPAQITSFKLGEVGS